MLITGGCCDWALDTVCLFNDDAFGAATAIFVDDEVDDVDVELARGARKLLFVCGFIAAANGLLSSESRFFGTDVAFFVAFNSTDDLFTLTVNELDLVRSKFCNDARFMDCLGLFMSLKSFSS